MRRELAAIKSEATATPPPASSGTELPASASKLAPPALQASNPAPKSSATQSKADDDADIAGDELAAADGCTFRFLVADKIRTSMDHLLKCQDIMLTHPDWLVQKPISFAEAARGEYVAAGEYIAVSHRWEMRDDPDPEGAQCALLRRYLDEHPRVQFVWLDYCSLPQGTRTEEEQREFDKTLQQVNLLYVGLRVLVLVDLQYPSRFWTQVHCDDGSMLPPPTRTLIRHCSLCVSRSTSVGSR